METEMSIQTKQVVIMTLSGWLTPIPAMTLKSEKVVIGVNESQKSE